MSSRPPVPKETEAEVLRLSRRRCCVCYGLQGDLAQKEGQIAHLDHDPSNNNVGNLVWLCLAHHDGYDTRHSQSKGMTELEVRKCRDELYRLPTAAPDPEPSLVIKDSEFTTDVKDAKEAIGMEVNRPAVLNNVRSKLTVTGNVERAVGFSTNQSMTGIMAFCRNCGQPVPAACTGRHLSVKVRCRNCGTENEFRPS